MAESGNTVADGIALRRRPKLSICDLIRGPAIRIRTRFVVVSLKVFPPIRTQVPEALSSK